MKKIKEIDINKMKNNIIFQTVSALLILILLAAIGAGIAITKHRMDYESVATKYFSAYLRDDTESMYEYVHIDESEFINYNQFALRIASERAAVSISEYKFSKPVKKNGRVTYTVTYENEISEEEESFTIVLKKCHEKWYNIIPEYKVIIDDRILENLSVEIPEGTTLYIDDQLANNGTVNDETQTVNYEISYIFSGEHTFYVESDFGEATVIQDIEESGESISVPLEDISMKESDKTALISEEENIIEAFYENAMDKDKSYKDVKSYFPDDSKLIKKVKKCFNATREVLYPDSVSNVDSYNIIDLTFGEMEYDLTSFEYPNKAKITCSYRYEYTGSTDTSVLSSYTEKYSGVCNVKVTFTYEADSENGWVMTGIKMSNSNTVE